MDKCLIYHCSFSDGGFEEFTASSGHFGAAHADKFNIITALSQNSYQTCAVGVGTWFSGTDKNAICFIFLGHNLSLYGTGINKNGNQILSGFGRFKQELAGGSFRCVRVVNRGDLGKKKINQKRGTRVKK